MKIKSVVALIAGLLVCALTVAAEEMNSAERPKSETPPSQKSERLKELFSDLPDYGAAVTGSLGMKTPPRLVAGAPPASPSFLEPDKKVNVTVAIAIDEQGNVVAARIFKSDDARCDSLAISAILKWKFAPATNDSGPIKCVVRAPVEFLAQSTDAQHLGVAIGAFTYDMRRIGLTAPVMLKSSDLTAIKAARVTVTRAVDDTGVELGNGPPRGFFTASVGMISNDELTSSKLSMPSIYLRAPEKAATQLRSLEGFLELVIPANDPMGTAYISQLPEKLGRPLVSKELAAAKVTFTIFDQKTCASALTDPRDAAKLRELLIDPQFAAVPGWQRPISAEQMTDTDIAVAIDDPEERVVGLEFQTLYGAPITYNHNGWSHFEKTAGKRFSIYRLKTKISDDIQLVCWLATARSTLKQPFQLSNVPLPAHP